jgi:hypothetical protein
MAGKTVGKGIQKEVVKKAAGQIKMTGKPNKITIDLPGKNEVVVDLSPKYEILGATLNGKDISDQQLQQLTANSEFTTSNFVAVTLLPPCPWYTDPVTKAKKRLCLPGYTCT